MFKRKLVGAAAVAAVGWVGGAPFVRAAVDFNYSNGETKSAPIVVESDDGQSNTADARFIVNSGSATQSGAISHATSGAYPNGPFVAEKTGAGSLTFSGNVSIGGTPTTPGYFYASSGNVTFTGGADIYYLSADGGNVTVTNGEVGTDVTYIGTYATSTLTLQGAGTLSHFTNFLTLAFAANSNGTLNFGAPSGQAPVAPGTLIAPEVRAGSGNGTVVFNHTNTNYSTSTRFTGIDTMRHEAGVTTTLGNVSVGNLDITGGSFTNFANLTGANLTVAQGATIRASSLGFTNTSISGTLGAGSETMVGQLGIGPFTFNDDTTLQLRASNTEYFANGVNYNDSVITFDTVNFDGTLSMVLADGFRPEVGEKIHIIDFNAGWTGNFDEVVFNVPGYQGEMIFETDFIDFGGFVFPIETAKVLITSTVPEPASMALLFGVGGLALLRRRRGRN